MKTVLAIGLVFCHLLTPHPTYAQAERTVSQVSEPVASPSLQPPGENLPAATRGNFSVSSRRDSIGTIPVGSKKTDSVTVTNTAKTTLTISSVKSSNAQFSVLPTSATILPSATRKFGITFAPTSGGLQTTSIIFTHTGPTSPDTVTAFGSGALPTFSVAPKSLAFGFVVIATGRTDSVAVTNSGSASLVISGVTTTNARYSVSPLTGTLQPGQTSTFRITFVPTVSGIQTGNIIFAHNGSTPRDTVTVVGTGTGFSVNKRSVTFPGVPLGSNGKDSVVVSNAGSTALTINNVTSSNDRFSMSPTSASIPAAGTAKFFITFTPANTTTQSGSVVFSHSASSSPDTIAVSGTGTGTLPGFSVNRKTVPFGLVPLGTTKNDSVIVTNPGTAPLVISNVSSNNATFNVTPASATIQPSQLLTFFIAFAPVNMNSQAGNILFAHNAPGGSDTVNVNGTGTGMLATFAINRRSLAFGNVPVGSISTDSLIVTNLGTTTLTISNVGSSTGSFSVNPANATIPGSTSKTFIVTFAPANSTTQSGVLVFTHNGSTSPDTVTVSGTGSLPGLTLNRNSVQFGLVPIGGSRLDSVIVTNSGTAPLVITSIVSNNDAFTLRPTNLTLQPSQAQALFITFTPANTNAQSGNIVVTSNGQKTLDTVAVSGTGTRPGLALSRNSVQFGLVPIGGSRLDSVIVTNSGTAPLVITSIASNNDAFTLHPSNLTLQPSQAQALFITFTPANTNAQSGNIVVTSNGQKTLDTVAVSGTGAEPGFSLNRDTVPFGSVPLGGQRFDSVIVSNTGKAPLVITNIASTNGAFTVNRTNDTLQASQARSFLITFTPENTNTASGNIVFTFNAPGAHDTVVVIGTGAGATAGFSPNRNTVPFGIVTIGGSRLDSVTVTNTGTTSFTISNVVSDNSAFTVAPTNATLDATQAQTFYLTFTPANTNLQSGNMVFTHTGAGSPDTVTVSGTGTLAVFSINRKTVSFGGIQVGHTAQDSVIVKNVGASTLTILNVTSSNNKFTVNPTNASIAVGVSTAFTIAFTPTNTTAQSGKIVFTHIASSSPDTVAVDGTGSLAVFSVNRTNVTFGFVSVGGTKLDSVVVTNTGTTPLVVSNIVSNNSVFVVNPLNATIPPTTSTAFSITCSPLNTTPQNGTLVFTHNASTLHDSITVSGTGIAQLASPTLLSPPSGSIGQLLPLTCSWNSVGGATGYWLELATDPSFTTIAMSDPTIVSTSRQVSGLPYNAKYYWRVSTRSAGGAGPFSSAWSVTTVPSGPLTTTVSFSGDLSSTSYRMFGMPGVGNRTVGEILSGTQSVDWRILRDTGKDTTYPAYYEDLNASSVLKTGEGYWLLAKRDLTISRTDTLPPIGSDGTYAITLHSGWNIISNPFNAVVQRTAVIAANGLPAGTLFWEHIGTTTTSSGATIDPFKGYYFDNDTSQRSSLKMPYPFATSVSKIAGTPEVDWRVELIFDNGKNSDRDNYIGIAPGVQVGRNELDQHDPPLFFDEGSLYFVRPEWDSRHPRFATDIRPALGNGQVWEFEVWNPRGGIGTLTFHGIDQIPAQNEAFLVNMLNSSPVDLRQKSEYSYQSSESKMHFMLIVGTKGFVSSETAKLIPTTNELFQNFPNPFNPSTTISYQIPASTNIRLEILSVLGQRVRVLDEGYRRAATYSILWDGKDANSQTVSSGVYFCRLIAGENIVRMRKLLLLR